MPVRPPKPLDSPHVGRRYGVRSEGSPADRPLWDLTYGKPANLEALDGSEGIDNSDVVIRPDGTLGYDGTGGGPVDALEIANGPAEAGATAGADWDSNVSNKPTLGTLAAKSEIDGDDAAAGYALIETGSGAPTATRFRFYVDTDNGTQWYDSGTTVQRTSAQQETGSLGSNTKISATTPTIVSLVHFPSVAAINTFLIPYLQTQYQSPDEATVDTLTAQWSVYAIREDTPSAAVGDNVLTAGTDRQVAWQGTSTGLNFTTVSGDVIRVADDANNARADQTDGFRFFPDTYGSRFIGGVTIALCLDITTGGGGADGVLLTGATTFTVQVTA